MKKIISFFLIVVFLSQVVLFAQDTQQQGYADGERDAAADVSGGMWIAVGCLTGGFSYIYPDLFNPAIPQGKLVGKSPGYVAGYTDGYNAKRKEIIHKNSCIGGVVGWGCCVIYYVAVVAATTASSATSYSYLY